VSYKLQNAGYLHCLSNFSRYTLCASEY